MHLDPVAWGAGFLQVHERELPPELFADLREKTPQATLRDLYRPVQDFFVMTPAELAAALYHDPASPAARAASETPTEGDALIEFHLESAKSLATAAKYLWPIPNRGLAKRTHRIAAPTLIVWGASDGIASPRYAEALRERIAGARVTIVEEAGHLPHEEQPAKLAEIVSAFLAEEGTHADEVRHLPGTVPPSGRQPAART